MARRPNYAFERNTRAKAKAEKREAKRQAKRATRANDGAEDAAGERGPGPSDSEQEVGS
jgi:hypothetical protein